MSNRALCLFLLLASSTAWAEGGQLLVVNPEQLSRIMGSADGNKHKLNTAGTGETILRWRAPAVAGVQGPLLFPLGFAYAFKASGGKCVGCWTMTSSISFVGAVASEQAFHVVDSITGYIGRGACWEIDDKETITDMPHYDTVKAAIGYRRGFCATRLSGTGVLGGAAVRVPCASDADCSADSLGAGTVCSFNNWDSTLRKEGAVFVKAQCDANDTYLSARMLR